MPKVWTHGRWTVKPGREDDFVRALHGIEEEARAELGTIPSPTLLRDREHTNVFVTFGAWESVEQIEAFRSFLFPRLGSLREVLESFEPHTLDEVELD